MGEMIPRGRVKCEAARRSLASATRAFALQRGEPLPNGFDLARQARLRRRSPGNRSLAAVEQSGRSCESGGPNLLR